MKRLVPALFLLLLLTGFASATDTSYPIGYITPGGYAWRGDGYWYYGDQAYTRTQEWVPGYYTTSSPLGCNSYACRTWVPGYYYWKYTAYTKPTVYQPQLPSHTDPGWRSKILDIAAAREKLEGEITRSAFEQQNYMEAVQALGLRAARPNIPYVGVYGAANATYATNFGANGNTQYGYRQESFNTIAQVYGNTDLNTLYQQAAQLTAGAQRLGGEANSGFQTLVGTEGANRARVAEILAKGQMAQQILNSLTAAPQAEVRGYSFRVEKGRIERTEDPKVVTPDQKAALKEKFEQLASARCYDCHNDKDPKGGFKIADYYTLSMEQKNKVWEVISTPDDKKMMPRSKDGGPGKRLTPDEQRLFFLN